MWSWREEGKKKESGALRTALPLSLWVETDTLIAAVTGLARGCGRG